jgi:TRAP-type mannitol/chloroaromatic compound transport system substrate-binding protein
MKRRDFIKNASAVGAGAVLLGACQSDKGSSKSVHIKRKKTIKIKLATSWPANFPIMGTGIERFAKRVNEISEGSIKI